MNDKIKRIPVDADEDIMIDKINEMIDKINLLENKVNLMI